MAGEINFGLLQQPDYFGNALASLDAGQRQRSSRNKRNALAMYGTDPQGAINALSTEDPELAFRLQDRESDLADRKRKEGDRQARINATKAYATGDTNAARQELAGLGDMDAIAKLDEASRAAAKQAAEDLAKAGLSLKNSPYEKRREALADPEFQAWLGQHGFPQDRVAGFDPTDQALDTFIRDAMSFTEQLEQQNKDRDFGLKKEKQAWDMKHGDQQVDVARRNAGTSAYSARTGRMSYEARKAAGGFGTPGAAGQWEEF